MFPWSMFFRLPQTAALAHSDVMKDDSQLKEISIEVLKPIFPDYTDEQLILAGERIADFLEYAYMLCKDELPSNRRSAYLKN